MAGADGEFGGVDKLPITNVVSKEANMGKLICANVGCGDASIIIGDNCTFLVDTHKIEEYSEYLPENKALRGVFITHQHTDHFSGLEYLFENDYSIGCLIYSPYSRRNNDNSVTLAEWQEFNKWRDKFEAKGTSLRAPSRQASWDKPYWTVDGIDFWIIGPNNSVASSDTREIHDASLVVKVNIGNRKVLFTGDASDKNLNKISKNVKHYCGDILHVSHHGSINGADIDFIKGCNARYSVISTESGVYSNVPHATALSRYRDNTSEKVYRTDTFGPVIWSF